MHTLSSSFLFPSIIYRCKIYQLQCINVPRKKEKLIQNESRKGPNLKYDSYLRSGHNLFQVRRNGRMLHRINIRHRIPHPESEPLAADGGPDPEQDDQSSAEGPGHGLAGRLRQAANGEPCGLRLTLG